ncbi:MAG TPA: hypothetical protein VF773_00850 [Verrucomicrobiae bacterium]
MIGLIGTHFFVFGQEERAEASWANVGPIYDQVPTVFREGERTEILGPIFSLEKSGSASLFTISPLFSLYRDSTIPQTETELGYPILSFDKFGKEYRFQILQVIAWSGGETLQGGDKKRTTIFPVYFRQRAPNPDDNYVAVVPFYGRMKNRIFRDRIFFVMLPAFLRTEKRGVITDNYLFPFFHKRYGAGVSGWQFWPVVGQEKKEITVSTNNWGDAVVSGGHEKFMALWPIHFNNTLGIGTTNVQKQFVLLPFYTSQVASNRVSKSYGFPIGYTHTIDREKKYEEWDMPWPLIGFARGEGKTMNRVWPFFSEAKTPTLQSDFYAWPIYKFDRITAAPLDRRRTRILLFLYSDLVEENTVQKTALRRKGFWPLYTWRKDHKNNERLQVLSILEPLLPNNKSIERVYSPFYALYRQEENGENGNSSRSFLWNLYRSDKRGETRRTSALFGLFQRERTAGEETKWRVLFVPFRTGGKGGE